MLQLLQDDKGLHLIAVFGLQAQTAPSIPAVQSVLELLASPDVTQNLACHIGVLLPKKFIFKCGIFLLPS